MLIYINIIQLIHHNKRVFLKNNDKTKIAFNYLVFLITFAWFDSIGDILDFIDRRDNE